MIHKATPLEMKIHQSDQWMAQYWGCGEEDIGLPKKDIYERYIGRLIQAYIEFKIAA